MLYGLEKEYFLQDEDGRFVLANAVRGMPSDASGGRSTPS